MFRLVYFPLLLIGLFLFACKSDQTANDKVQASDSAPAEVVLPDDGGPSTLEAIKSYGDSIDAVLSGLTSRGPVPVPVGPDIFQGTAYTTADGTPLLLYCERNGVEQWYYLYKRRITQYRDRRPVKKQVEEQHWYYTFQEPIHGERLVAADAKGLKGATPKEIAVGDIEPYYTLGEVTIRVMEILFGRMPK
jgi:hypothetical protein